MESWLPIDTCKKEEHNFAEPVLLLIEWDDVAYVGFWGKESPFDDTPEMWRVKWNHEAPAAEDPDREPTHWMPLPKFVPLKSN